MSLVLCMCKMVVMSPISKLLVKLVEGFFSSPLHLAKFWLLMVKSILPIID